jgi:hypothetical protein
MMIIEHSKYTKLDHLPHFQEKLRRIYIYFWIWIKWKEADDTTIDQDGRRIEKRQNPKKKGFCLL